MNILGSLTKRVGRRLTRAIFPVRQSLPHAQKLSDHPFNFTIRNPKKLIKN